MYGTTMHIRPFSALVLRSYRTHNLSWLSKLMYSLIQSALYTNSVCSEALALNRSLPATVQRQDCTAQQPSRRSILPRALGQGEGKGSSGHWKHKCVQPGRVSLHLSEDAYSSRNLPGPPGKSVSMMSQAAWGFRTGMPEQQQVADQCAGMQADLGGCLLVCPCAPTKTLPSYKVDKPCHAEMKGAGTLWLMPGAWTPGIS